jgi:hypothetical protein
VHVNCLQTVFELREVEGLNRPGLTIRGAPGAGYVWAPISAPKELNDFFCLSNVGKKS